MDAQYIQDKLDTLQEEKKDLQSQLQHAFSDTTIEKLEEQIQLAYELPPNYMKG